MLCMGNEPDLSSLYPWCVGWKGKEAFVCKFAEWRLESDELQPRHQSVVLLALTVSFVGALFHIAIFPNSLARARELPYNKINRTDLHTARSAGDKRVGFCKVE